MDNNVSLADIKAFVLIAEVGSFTKAAELLLCSRSYLSRQLSQLESVLGVKLITRTTRSQRLTEQGKIFFEQCQASLRGIEQAVDGILESTNRMQGVININCVGGPIGEEIVAGIVNDFIKLHPEISINLDFSSKRVDLIAGEFDFVFRMGSMDDSGLIARKLSDLSIVTLASPSYLDESGFPTHPRELKNHRCITGSVNTWAFEDVSKQGIKSSVTISGQFICKNGRAMVKSALAGNGVIRVPELYCHEEIVNGSLIPVFDAWVTPSVPFSLVYAQDKHQPARLQAFIQFVMDNFTDYLPVNR